MTKENVGRPLLSATKGGAVLLPLLAALLSACAGPSESLIKRVDGAIANRDYSDAESLIAGAKDSSFGKKNMVLYYLDIGAVQLDGGRYKDSVASLAAAENRMDELFTKSIHKEAGTFLLNDNTVDYGGERFERALVNVDLALGYLLQGDRDGAMVEIRKLSRLLQEYADVYGATKTSYKDDAFGEYLSGLLYADDGQPDDARISFQKAGALYRRASPADGEDEQVADLDAPRLGPNDGELVFIHANGIAPRKQSRTFQVAWGQGIAAMSATRDDEAQAGQAQNALRAGFIGNAITVAYPKYVQGFYRIVRSDVELDDGRRARTHLIENVSAIAMRDLDERQALIRTRAIARATIKYILAHTLSNAVARKYGQNSPAAFLTNFTANAVAAGTEVADTRAWTTLPSQYRIARVSLPAGEHVIRTVYGDASGAEVDRREFKVNVRRGARTYIYDRTAL